MPWAICILIINNFEGTKCVLDRCSLSRLQGVSLCLPAARRPRSCWGRDGVCQAGGTARSSQPAPVAPFGWGRRAWDVCLLILNQMAAAQRHPREQRASPCPGHTALLCSCHEQPGTSNRGLQKLRCCFSEDARRELSSDFSLALSLYICSVRMVFRPFSLCSGHSPVISEWFWAEGSKYFISNSTKTLTS